MNPREMSIGMMSDAELQGVIRAEGMAARRHMTIEDVELSERRVERAKELLASKYLCGRVGRDELPDQG